MIDTHAIMEDVSLYILSNFMPGEKTGSLRGDDLLFESGIIDSAGAMTLICFLEEKYDIQIYDEELFPDNFATVAHIVDFIAKKIDGAKIQ